ncbi:MAG TPA: FAD-binding oxidoreductase [Bdellovibrionota bacterium]|jgi:glycine/D-amino acid oxidase-like deaminating enzyme|nr:FAD-binding oxidoreductase [Bdellovibrionota bacterium]
MEKGRQEIHAEVLIVGAGLMGSALAMHLGRLGVSGVHCADFDLEGPLSSSELNAGGVRGSFGQPVNILASKLSIEFFATVAADVGYRPCGYLWLLAPERVAWFEAARRNQLAAGWPSEVWDVPELRRQRPFIDKTDGIAQAVFVPRDGLVNPNLLKNLFRERARSTGAQFHDRLLIQTAEFGPTGVKVRASRHAPDLALESRAEALAEQHAPRLGETVIHAKRVVNCAGPWAPAVAKALGYPCPSHPVRRQISIFDCRDVDLTPYGMIVDTSGVYFHPEATNGLAGYADPEEKAGESFRYDGEDFFMEKIWAPLFERSTGFERLKHLTGWAGLYEISPDHSAIVGPVEQGEPKRHPGRVFEAHSFSGHGAMHSYAVGLALAELMAEGRYSTLDLTVLAGSRFETGRPVSEGAVI